MLCKKNKIHILNLIVGGETNYSMKLDYFF